MHWLRRSIISQLVRAGDDQPPLAKIAPRDGGLRRLNLIRVFQSSRVPEQEVSVKVLSVLSLIVLATAVCTSAASISFTPAGAQLDADPIFDISKPALSLTFEIKASTAGLPANLKELSYEVYWDITELSLDHVSLDPNRKFPATEKSAGIPGYFTITHKMGNIAPAPGAFVVSEIRFDVSRRLDNNGFPDFRIALLNAVTVPGGNVTAMFAPAAQEVEVQPSPEPATCLLIGGASFALVMLRRKMRPLGRAVSAKD
jgi:hypothetical protein